MGRGGGGSPFPTLDPLLLSLLIIIIIIIIIIITIIICQSVIGLFIDNTTSFTNS